MDKSVLTIEIHNSTLNDMSMVYVYNEYKLIHVSKEKTEKQAWKQAAIRLRQLANEAQKRYDEFEED